MSRDVQKLLTTLAPVMLASMLTACVASGPVLESESSSLSSASSIAPGMAEGGIRVVSELPPPSDSQGGELQPISPNDILEVNVFQVPDLDRTVQVDSRGIINLPLIGAVQAAGKSARQLESEIAAKYDANYLQSPQISVFVKESMGQRVTVEGEVRKAGIYPVTSETSVLAAIAQSGGLSDIADESRIFVFRRYGNERLVAHVNLREVRKGKRNDPRIFGGDVIVVFSSKGKIAMKNLREVLGIASSARVLIP